MKNKLLIERYFNYLIEFDNHYLSESILSGTLKAFTMVLSAWKQVKRLLNKTKNITKTKIKNIEEKIKQNVKKFFTAKKKINEASTLSKIGKVLFEILKTLVNILLMCIGLFIINAGISSNPEIIHPFTHVMFNIGYIIIMILFVKKVAKILYAEPIDNKTGKIKVTNNDKKIRLCSIRKKLTKFSLAYMDKVRKFILIKQPFELRYKYLQNKLQRLSAQC